MSFSLSDNPIFEQFDERERTLLESVMKARTLSAGEYLFRGGDIARGCFFVLSGSVEIGLENDSGFQTLATQTVGDIVGELALIDGGRRSAACRGLSDDTQLAELYRDDFDLVFNAGSPFAYHLLDLISERIIDRLRGAVKELSQVIDTERTPAES